MPAYTLSDRGTWLGFEKKWPLALIVDGDSKLINDTMSYSSTPRRMGKTGSKKRDGWPIGLTRRTGSEPLAAMKWMESSFSTPRLRHQSESRVVSCCSRSPD